MSIKVIVPQIGQSIAEATIVKWYRQVGERIEKGETLVEIGTDKINTEIPAPASGTLQQILVSEGETVPINTEIAILTEDGFKEPITQPLKKISSEEIQLSDSAPQRHSPYVRKLALENGIDLNQLQGSGEGGRITKEDVLRAIESKSSAILQPPAAPPPIPAADTGIADSKIKRVPMTRMRKLIAEHMMLSKRTAADLTTVFEVDLTEVVRQRERAKEEFQAQHGLKLTYLPFLLSAICSALKQYPILNSSIEEETVVFRDDVHLGIAVEVENGLIVPVIHNADEKNIVALARSIVDLATRARTNKLLPSDLEGGTFTVTNPGVFGALMGTPIIHQPQVAILGIGAIEKRAVVINDAIAIRSCAYFSLTYDHRAMDGATADRFLAHLKNILEKQCPLPEV